MFKNQSKNLQLIAALAAASLPLTQPVIAQSTDAELEQLREEIAALRAQFDSLETSVEQAPKSTLNATVDHRGFVAETADKRYSFRIRPRAQIDSRIFLDGTGRDEIVLRRVRPVFQGTAPNITWRIMPELASDVRILDASLDLHLGESHLLRVGKFKGVIGLERLQGFGHLKLGERALPSNLTPTREIGAELQGKLANKTIGWAVGVYNGTLDDSDLRSNQNLSGGDFDIGARIFWEPFKTQSGSFFEGLGVGFAAAGGPESVTIADSDSDRRIRYRTSGRNTFFRYADGVVIDGDRLRLNPHLYYYNGPFGLLAEYVSAEYELTRGGVSRKVDTDGWTTQASWILTGEKSSHGAVRPKKPFDLADGTWGAFEVALRYSQLEVDGAAFEGDSTTRLAHSSAVSKARSIAAGLNWYLTENLQFLLNYEETDFSGHGASRPTEKLVLTRFEIDF